MSPVKEAMQRSLICLSLSQYYQIRYTKGVLSFSICFISSPVKEMSNYFISPCSLFIHPVPPCKITIQDTFSLSLFVTIYDIGGPVAVLTVNFYNRSFLGALFCDIGEDK